MLWVGLSMFMDIALVLGTLYMIEDDLGDLDLIASLEPLGSPGVVLSVTFAVFGVLAVLKLIDIIFTVRGLIKLRAGDVEPILKVTNVNIIVMLSYAIFIACAMNAAGVFSATYVFMLLVYFLPPVVFSMINCAKLQTTHY